MKKRINRTKTVLALMILLVLVGLAQSQTTLPDGVTEQATCKNITWEESFPTIETCMRPYTGLVCTDEPTNQSCSEQLLHEPYPCETGTRVETKSRLECKTESLTIQDKVKLNIPDYECIVEKSGKEFVAVCDSKKDGNGDGKCTSGESCMKFVIDGSTVQQYERNSQDSFVQSDDSFFLNRASVEVLQ